MNSFFENDFTLKIISLIIALILWMYVMSEQNPVVTRTINDIPVRLVDLDTDKFVLKNSNENFEVKVEVKGRRDAVSKLTRDDIYAEVKMRGRIEGENLIPVTVNVPENIELIKTVPSEIMVVLDAVVEEQHPVAVKLIGDPKQGFTALSPSLKQKEVLLRGPRSLIDSVKQVEVKLDITGAEQNVAGSYPVKAINAKGEEIENITYRPDVVDVVVPVVAYKDLPVKPTLTGLPAEGYAVSDVWIQPDVVSLIGDKDMLDEIQEIYTTPFNIKGKSNDVEGMVQIKVPKGLKLLKPDSVNVKIVVKIAKQENPQQIQTNP